MKKIKHRYKNLRKHFKSRKYIRVILVVAIATFTMNNKLAHAGVLNKVTDIQKKIKNLEQRNQNQQTNHYRLSQNKGNKPSSSQGGGKGGKQNNGNWGKWPNWNDWNNWHNW